MHHEALSDRHGGGDILEERSARAHVCYSSGACSALWVNETLPVGRLLLKIPSVLVAFKAHLEREGEAVFKA